MKNNKNNNSVKIYLLIITLISIFLPCKAEKNIKIIFFPPYWNCAVMEMNHSNKGIDIYCVIPHYIYDATQKTSKVLPVRKRNKAHLFEEKSGN